MDDCERARGLLSVVMSCMEPVDDWYDDGKSPRAITVRLSWPWVRAVHEVIYGEDWRKVYDKRIERARRDWYVLESEEAP